MKWTDFRSAYTQKSYPEQFKSRSEYLKYFKETYPLEYQKFRDYSNKSRHNYVPKAQTAAERELYLKKQRERYYKNKKWYQDYYKEYMKNPINRQKNKDKSREYYYTKIRKVKDIPPVKVRNYEIKQETFERKPAIKIDKLTNPITIDFSL